MKSLCIQHYNLSYIVLIGISFIYLSSSQTSSEQGLEYINRDDIVENIEIIESSQNVDTSTVKVDGK